MKSVFALCLVALTTTASALADFQPGRVRPGAVAEMKVVEATGQFEGVKSAMLYQNFEDGKGFVSLKLAVVKGQALTLPITQVKETACGDFAWSDDVNTLGGHFNAEFSDYTNIACRMRVENEWKLKVDHTDNQGNRSTLVIEGKPEFLHVTL